MVAEEAKKSMQWRLPISLVRRMDGRRPLKAPFLACEQIYLRGYERADLQAIIEWLNDSEVTHLLFMGLLPSNLEMLVMQWERDRNSQEEVNFAVCDKRTDAFF